MVNARASNTAAAGPRTADSGLDHASELRRVLSFRHLLVYGMIFMSPIAPMVIYGYVADASFGMVPLVYFIGVVAVTFTALSYRQMSRRFPQGGSVYTYVQKGFNNHSIGFMFGWLILIDYLLVPALLYRFVGTYLEALIPGVPFWIYLVVFVVFISAVNILGIVVAARTAYVLLGFGLIALVVFVVAAVNYVFIEGGGAGGFSLVPIFQPEHLDLGFVATATSIAVLSFLGFDAISTLADETKKPKRSIGNATVAALLVLGFLFISQTYLAALVLPDPSATNIDLTFFEIARIAGGDGLYVFLLIVQVVTIVAAGLAAQLAISRILLTMARDRMLPFSSAMAKVNPKFNTPVVSTVVVALISAAVAIFVSADTIAVLVNFGALTAFLGLNAAVFWFFIVRERKRRFIDLLNFGLFPVLGFLIVAFVWSGFDAITLLVGFSWLAVGLVVLAVKTKGFRKPPPSVLKESVKMRSAD